MNQSLERQAIPLAAQKSITEAANDLRGIITAYFEDNNVEKEGCLLTFHTAGRLVVISL